MYLIIFSLALLVAKALVKINLTNVIVQMQMNIKTLKSFTDSLHAHNV